MNMKFWILTLLSLKGKLDKLCNMIEKRTMDIALALNSSPESFEELLLLNDLKRRIVNLKVLNEFISKDLTEGQQALLNAFLTSDHIKAAADFGVCVSTFTRKINRIIDDCCGVLFKLQFDEARLVKEYKDIALVRYTYKSMKKKFGGKTSKKNDMLWAVKGDDRSSVNVFEHLCSTVF